MHCVCVFGNKYHTHILLKQRFREGEEDHMSVTLVSNFHSVIEKPYTKDKTNILETNPQSQNGSANIQLSF